MRYFNSDSVTIRKATNGWILTGTWNGCEIIEIVCQTWDEVLNSLESWNIG